MLGENEMGKTAAAMMIDVETIGEAAMTAAVTAEVIDVAQGEMTTPEDRSGTEWWRDHRMPRGGASYTRPRATTSRTAQQSWITSGRRGRRPRCPNIGANPLKYRTEAGVMWTPDIFQRSI